MWVEETEAQSTDKGEFMLLPSWAVYILNLGWLNILLKKQDHAWICTVIKLIAGTFQVFSNISNIFKCFQIFQIFSGAWSTTQVGSCLDGDCQPRISSPEVTPNICAFWSDRIFVAFNFAQIKYLCLLILIRTNICGFWSHQIFVAFNFDPKTKTTCGFLLLNLDRSFFLLLQWCTWWARHPEAKSYREESWGVFR